jgi:hypothetical protein
MKEAVPKLCPFDNAQPKFTEEELVKALEYIRDEARESNSNIMAIQLAAIKALRDAGALAVKDAND